MAAPPLPAGSPGTTTTFGSDFSGINDIDPNWSYLANSPTTPNDESIALTQAIARRLTTPRGGLFYDLNYGTDIRDFISSSIPIAQAISAIEAECRKDERVDDCDVTISVVADEWFVTIECKAHASGPFALTLAVSAVSVELLNQRQGPA